VDVQLTAAAWLIEMRPKKGGVERFSKGMRVAMKDKHWY
jgi:hypothetical protein